MYERFTDRSRRVMQYANQEAQRLNSPYIGAEHILLGILKEGQGIAAAVLGDLQIDLKKTRQAIELKYTGTEEVVSSVGRLPNTPNAKKVIEYAIEEARALNHNYVGTEHLLLGLVRLGQGIAFEVLTELGVSYQPIRVLICKRLDPAFEPENPSLPVVSQECIVTFSAGPSGEPVLIRSPGFQDLQRRLAEWLHTNGGKYAVTKIVLHVVEAKSWSATVEVPTGEPPPGQ